MKLIMAFILVGATAFAEDQVIKSLKVENEKMEAQIEKNKELIKMRQNSAYDIKSLKDVKERERRSTFSIGVEKFAWQADLNNNRELASQGLAFSYTYFKNRIGFGVSFTRIEDYDYPANRTATLIIPLKAEVMYNYQIYENFSLLPTLGYIDYSVSSPDAGNSDDSDINKFENELIEKIEDNSGFVAGLGLRASLNSYLVVTLKVDIGSISSTGLSLGYQF